MNKIFKVIWNHATQTWTAVSELTKARGKTSSQTDERQSPQAQSAAVFKLSAQGISALMITAALFGSNAAFASSVWTQSNNSSDIAHRPTVVIGEGYGESNDRQEGAAANAGAHGSSTTGREGALHSISIGGGANVVARYGTAMGYHATLGTDEPHSRHYRNNYRENQNAAGSVAIGAYAHTNGQTDKNKGNSARYLKGDANFAFAGDPNKGKVTVFSIGNSESDQYTYRQLQNVAAGDITATSTDGINGSQLYQAIRYLERNAGGKDWHYVSINSNNQTEGSNYKNDGAKSPHSIAIGESATTTQGAEDAVALGTNSTARHSHSVALGGSSNAGGQESVAIGYLSSAIGGEAGANQFATAVGTHSSANRPASNAFGAYAKADGNFSTAVGTQANATGQGATAIGVGALATSDNPHTYGYATALGQNSRATGVSSNALGRLANATGYYTTAVGANTLASGSAAIAIGGGNGANKGAQATGDHAIAVGEQTHATNDNAVAVGFQSNATNSNAVAVGAQSNATNDNAVAIGSQSNATDSNTVAVGHSAKSSANSAISLGNNSNASQGNAIAVGKDSLSTNLSSISIGSESKATGFTSTSLGWTANASGNSSVAVGPAANASEKDSLAVGAYANSTHKHSVALGADSQDGAAVAVNSATVNHISYEGFAGHASAENGVVSIGKAGRERQLINVAAGRITSSSTDAINGSQLYAVADKLGAGWDIKGKGDKKGSVKPSNSVDFIDGTATTATVSGSNGSYSVKYDVNAGDGLAIKNGKLVANGTKITAGTNVQVTGTPNGGYTISATDTNTHANVTSSDKSVTVTKTTATDGTPNYDLKVKVDGSTIVNENGVLKAVVKAGGTNVTEGDNVHVEGSAATGYKIHADGTAVAQGSGTKVTSQKVGNTTTYTVAANVASIAAGDNVNVSNNNGAYTISANGTVVTNGTGTTVSSTKNGNTTTYQVNANVADIQAGSNVNVKKKGNGVYEISANDTNTQASVEAAANRPISVTEDSNSNGTKKYIVDVKTGDGLKVEGGKLVANGTKVAAADNTVNVTSETAGNGTTTYKVKGNYTAGNGITLDGNTIKANVANIEQGDNVTVEKKANGVFKISATDTNTQASVVASNGAPVAITETNNGNGTKQYAVNVTTGKGLKVENGKLVANGTNVTAGDNVVVAGNAQDGYTVSAKGANVVAGKGTTVDVTENGNNKTFTVNANVSNIKAGSNTKVEKDSNGVFTISANATSVVAGDNIRSVDTTTLADGTKQFTVNAANYSAGNGVQITGNKTGGYTIAANIADIAAGSNVQVNKNPNGTVTISATDTNTHASVGSADKSVTIVESSNSENAKHYDLKVNVDNTTIVNDGGVLKAVVKPGVTIKQGDNVEVTGTADSGYTIAANSSSVVQGKGTKVTAKTTGRNTAYTVDANVSDIQGSDNVNVSKNADGVYTITANNTQATVMANASSAVSVTEGTVNGNGTKNYVVDVKTGKGLKVEDGKLVANGTTITQGDNVKVTGNAQDGYTISANGTKVAAVDNTINVTSETAANGTTTYKVQGNYTAGKGVSINGNTITANVADVVAGDNIQVSKNTTTGAYTIAAETAAVASGTGTTVSKNKVGNTTTYTVNANVADIEQGDNITVEKKANGVVKLSAKDTNTQASVAKAANAPITIKETENGNKTKQYELDIATGDGLKVEGGKLVANGTTITAGKNVNVTGNANSGYTIDANDTVVAAGDNVKSVDKAVANDGTTTYTVNAANYSAGKGVKITGDKTQGYVIAANVANITAGDDSVTVNNQDGNVTITAKNTQASVSSSKKTVKVTPTANGNSTQNYDLDVNVGSGLKVNATTGAIEATGTNLTQGDNVIVTGNATDGYTIAAKGTVVAKGNGTTVSQSTSGNTTTYTVNANVSDIKGGNNVNVSKAENGTYTIDVDTSVPTTDLNVADGKVTEPSAAEGSKFANASEVAQVVNNVSWSAAENGTGKGNVKAGSKVSFNNGAGTTANVTSDNNGVVVSYNVNTTTLAAQPNGTVQAGQNGNSFATATEVANAINNASFNATIGRDDTAFEDQNGATNHKVKAGETVKLQAGKNLKVKQSGANFTYATKDEVDFTRVNATTVMIGDKTHNTTLTSNANGLDVGGDKITNVSNGTLSNTSTDAVNGSQLYATNQNVTNINTTVAKGLNFAGNNGTAINKKLGETLNITGSLANDVAASAKNIRVDSENGNLTVKIAETPEFKGVNLSNNSNNVSLTVDGKGLKVGKDGANATISGVANATLNPTSTEAVNGSQLYATNQNVTNVTNDVAKGWNVTTAKVAGSTGNVESSNAPAKVAMGDTVKIQAGNNINLTQNGREIAIATSMTPSFTNVTTGDTVLSNDGLTIVGGPNVTKAGIDAAGKSITNVKAGVNGTDAVNLDQLNSTVTGSVANTTLTVTNGKVDAPETANAGKLVNATVIARTINNVSWAVAENDTNKGNVKAGSKVTFKDGTGTTANVTADTDGNVTVAYNVNTTGITTQANGTVQAGKTGNIFATATEVANAINNASFNATIGRDDAAFDDQAGITNHKVKAGETVKLQAGKNLKVKQDGANFTYATADNVTFTTVNTTKLIVGEPGQPGKNGVAIDGTNGTIGLNGKDGASANIKVEKGATTVNSNDNGQPIDRVKYTDSNNKTREVATLDDGLKFKGDNDTVINRTLGSTLNISGGANSSNLTDNNIGVVGNENGTLTVKLNKDLNLSNNGSVTIGNTTLNDGGLTIKNGPSVTNAGINAGDKKITNVTAGDLSADSKDAVNGSQLYATNQNITNISTNVAKGLNFEGNKGAPINKQLGETLKIIGALSDSAAASAKNVRVDSVDGNLTVKIADTPEFTGVNLSNSGNNVSLTTDAKGLNISKDGANATISGVANATLNATSTEAVNGSQLYATNNEIAKGWKIQAEKVVDSNGVIKGSSEEAKVAMGETVKVKAGNNIELTQNGVNISIATSATPTFTNVTTEKLIVGKPGQAGEKGIAIDGTNGTIGLNGKDGASANITVEKGTTTVNATDNGQKIDRVKYVDSNNKTREVATLDDGLKFVGDDGTTINRTLGSTLNISGGAATANLTDNNIGVVGNATTGALTVKLNKDIDLGSTGSVKIGDSTLNNGGLTINGGPSITKEGGVNAGGKTITNVTAGTNGTDAVNVNQLNSTVAKAVENTTLTVTNGAVEIPTTENAGKLVNATIIAQTINKSGWKVTAAEDGGTAEGASDELVNPGETVKLQAGKNVKVVQDGANFTFSTSDNIVIGEKGANGKDGVDGSIGVNGKDGSAVAINGKDGSIGLTGAPGKDGKHATATIKVVDGVKGLDGNDGKDGESKTRVVYEKPDGTTETVATMNDGLKFKGNQGETISKKLGETLNIVGELANNLNASAKNVRVDNDNGNLTVKIAENPEFKGITLKEGSNTVNLTTNANGLNVAKADGSNATISGVANATLNETSNEAVNGSQLYATNQNVTNLTNEVAKGWIVTTGTVANSNGVATNTTTPKVEMGDTVTVKAGNNIQINQDGKNIEISTSATPTFTNITTNEVIVGKDGKDGVDGKVGVSGKDGASVVLNGKDGSIGLTGARGADGKDGASTNLTVANGTTTVSERDGGNNVTRVTYTDKDKAGNNITREIATLDDGLKFKGDNDTVINRTLGSQLNIVGGAKEANLTDNNIGVVGSSNGTLTVKLNKDLNLSNNGSVTIGNTTLNDGGLTITGGPSITKDGGINAGNKAITNVTAGTNGTDAVNVNQLNTTVAKAVENTTLTVENGKVKEVPDADKGKLVNATVVAKAINDSGWTVTAAANGGTVEGTKDELVNPGETVKLQAGKNVKVVQDGANFTFSTSDNIVIGEKGEKGANGKDGVDGSIGVNGKDGSSVVINGKDGSIGLTGKNGKDGKDGASTNISVQKGTTTVNETRDGGKEITRVVYSDKDKNGNTITREIATMDDGLKFKGNKGETINKKLGETLEVVGELADNAEASAKNVRVDNENGKLTVKLANQVDLGSNGSITMGNVSVNHNGINAGNTTISNVKDGDISPTSKDAVNGSQLHATNQNVTNLSNTVAKGWNVQTQVVAGSTGIVKGSDKANVAMGDTVNVQAGNNIEITQNGRDIAIATSATPTFVNVTTNEVTVGKAGKDGVDGKIGVNGKDGASVSINGKDGSIGLTGAKGADGKDGASANIKVENGVKGLDGNDGKDGEGKTRIVYEKPNGEKETVATMNDGLTFAGDSGKESKRKLGEKVTVRGGQTDAKKLSHKPNIGVVSDGNGNLDVKLAKNLDLEKDGSVTIGNTTVNNDGVTIKGGPSITSGGINAGNKVISNVAPGVKDTDAVNVAQLKHQANRISNLDNKVNKNKKRADAGTASVAAMANIPQASLPGKSGVGFGIGHRGKQTAVAIGYSRVSDNAKHIIKFSAGMDSQRTGTVGAGYMYQW